MAKQIFARITLLSTSLSIAISIAISVVGMTACTSEAPAVGNTASSNTSSKATSEDAAGARRYKLDPEAAAIQISIEGVDEDSADTAKFQYLMRNLKLAGELSALYESPSKSETGIEICGVFSDRANQGEVYELIRSLETSARTTHLIASTVAGCTN